MSMKIESFENFRTTRRPRNFDEFWEASLKEGLDCEHKYVISKKDWLAIKESKAEALIDKIPVEELPKCEQIDTEHSKVGDFLPADLFTDMYDEKGEILGGLKDGDLLAYCCLDGATTWWKVRKDTKSNNSKDGLVRIK